MPWFQQLRHSEHCTLGIVSHNSNSSTLPMARIIFFDFFTEWVVGITLLQIGLKILSMRVTLDVLHEITNTRIFDLFHNCMWQSRHPEVDVSLLELERPVSTNGSPHSDSICIYVFVCFCVFVFSLNVQQTQWCFRSQVRNVCRFPEHSNWTVVLSKQVDLF